MPIPSPSAIGLALDCFVDRSSTGAYLEAKRDKESAEDNAQL